MNRIDEYEAVKFLGEQIGYGNIMTIAATLWRKKLKESGVPVEGAFVPTLPCAIKEGEWNKIMNNEIKLYDKELNKLEL